MRSGLKTLACGGDIAQLRKGLASMRASGAGVIQTRFCTALAEGCGTLGRVEDGFTAVAKALGAVE